MRIFEIAFKRKRVHLAIAVLILSIVCSPSPLMAFERYNEVKKYDPYFSKYSKRYFGPGFDWRHFKAQAVAESRLPFGLSTRGEARICEC